MLVNSWRDFEELMPRILPHVIQCTEGFAIDHLRDATIRACERARLWVIEDEFEAGKDGQELIMLPRDLQIYQLDQVLHCGRPLEAVSVQDLVSNRHRWHCGTGHPQFFAQVDENTLQILPRQDGAMIFVRGYAIPSPTAQRAPKAVLDRHREMLVNGALGRIMSVPNQPFTNPELAAYRLQLFESRLDEISREYVTGIQRAPLRTRARFM